jgi:hypothetical protein
MDKVVARLILDLHDDGSLSISGNIGDKALALGILDSARGAVEGLRPSPLLVPNRDVIAPPTLPLGPVVRP